MGVPLVRLSELVNKNLRSELAWAATGSFALNIAFSVIIFGTSVFLARAMGPAGYGSYSYALTWVNVLAIPASLGLNQLLVRNIAAYRARAEWGLVKGLHRWSRWIALLASLLLAAGGVLFVWLFRNRFDSQIVVPLLIALAAILPGLVQLRLQQSTMRGLNYILQGQLPEMLVQPLLFLLIVGGIYVIARLTLIPELVVSVNAFATLAALAWLIWRLARLFPGEASGAVPVLQTRAWLISAFPLLLISSLIMLNARIDTLTLGALQGAGAVGIYSVVQRGSDLLTFVLNPINRTIEPTAAHLYASHDLVQLQRLATKSARITFFLTLPLGLGFIFFGTLFLGLFGSAYVTGSLALSILVTGQLFSIACGSVVMLLVMTGFERDAAISVAVSVILAVILNPIFITRWGINGAALANSIGLVVWNVIMVIWVNFRLGIDPTVLGLARGNPQKEVV